MTDRVWGSEVFSGEKWAETIALNVRERRVAIHALENALGFSELLYRCGLVEDYGMSCRSGIVKHCGEMEHLLKRLKHEAGES